MRTNLFFDKLKEASRSIKNRIFLKRKERLVDALAEIKEEEDIYLDQKQKALREQPQAGQDKVIRESGGQDISAI
jgi:hypothetical protein